MIPVRVPPVIVALARPLKTVARPLATVAAVFITTPPPVVLEAGALKPAKLSVSLPVPSCRDSAPEPARMVLVPCRAFTESVPAPATSRLLPVPATRVTLPLPAPDSRVSPALSPVRMSLPPVLPIT